MPALFLHNFTSNIHSPLLEFSKGRVARLRRVWIKIFILRVDLILSKFNLNHKRYFLLFKSNYKYIKYQLNFLLLFYYVLSNETNFLGRSGRPENRFRFKKTLKIGHQLSLGIVLFTSNIKFTRNFLKSGIDSI